MNKDKLLKKFDAVTKEFSLATECRWLRHEYAQAFRAQRNYIALGEDLLSFYKAIRLLAEARSLINTVAETQPKDGNPWWISKKSSSLAYEASELFLKAFGRKAEKWLIEVERERMESK